MLLRKIDWAKERADRKLDILCNLGAFSDLSRKKSFPIETLETQGRNLYRTIDVFKSRYEFKFQ